MESTVVAWALTWKAGGAKSGERSGLQRKQGLAALRVVAMQQEVGVEVEAALGDDVGLKGADGSCGGVA